jgi:hypothetical protein
MFHFYMISLRYLDWIFFRRKNCVKNVFVLLNRKWIFVADISHFNQCTKKQYNVEKWDLKYDYTFNHILKNSLNQWSPKSAPRTTSFRRDWLRWSANPYRNKYFVLRGPSNDSKWSAHGKSLGTTALNIPSYINYI